MHLAWRRRRASSARSCARWCRARSSRRSARCACRRPPRGWPSASGARRVADRLRRLDEGAADIVVADDAELEGDAGLPARSRSPPARRSPAPARRRRRAPAPRARARRPWSCARRRRCGRRRSNPAARNRCIRRCRARGAIGGNGLCDCAPSSSKTTTSPFSMSRTYCAPMMSSAQVSEARIGQPSSLPSTSGRMPSGSRAPISFLLVRPTKRIGAFELAQRLDEAVDEAVAARARHQMQDHLGVGGRLHHGAVAHQLAAQREAVGEIAVVADGEAAAVEFGEQRLHVAQDGLAGGRIAHMADRPRCRAGGRSPRGGKRCRRPGRGGARNGSACRRRRRCRRLPGRDAGARAGRAR